VAKMQNPVMEKRKENLDRTLQLIKAIGKIDYAVIRAQLVMNLGCAKKTAEDYLHTLADGNYIYIRESKVYSKQCYEEMYEDKPIDDIDKALKNIQKSKPVNETGGEQNGTKTENNKES
jgi:hypothetical protein